MERVSIEDLRDFEVWKAWRNGGLRLESNHETLTHTEAAKKEERVFTAGMMKRETLEEAAERHAEPYRCPATNDDEYCRHDIVSAFNNGAKWQGEYMIEELEMHILINEHDWNRNPQAQFRDFAYWLQGFFEIAGTNKIDEGQAEMIKNHLNLVFKHEIDPSLNEGKSKEEVKQLQDIHDGKKKLSDFLKEGPPPKKDKDAVDWLKDKFKPSHIKPHKLHGGWESGSSDNTLLRC